MAGFHDPQIAFVHVEDLIDAIIAAAVHGRTCQGREPHNGDGRGVYYIADREFITFSQFAQYVADGLGRKWVFNLRMPLSLVGGAAWANEQTGRLFGIRSTFNPDKIREASCPAWTCDIESTEQELRWRPATCLQERVYQFASTYKKR
jgi:nucleoside-diphosphate-sugar epimerase